MSMCSRLPWVGAEEAIRAGRCGVAEADDRAVIPVRGRDPDAALGYAEPRVYLRTH